VGHGRRGKGSQLLLMADGNGLPISGFLTSAQVAEVHAVETLIETRACEKQPERLLYDKAADADWLRDGLEKQGIELICPHRENRTKPPLQDGRSLRRYRRRWTIERTISWLKNNRRLVTRWEYYPHLFEGFYQLACLMLLLKWF
jgi:transposase